MLLKTSAPLATAQSHHHVKNGSTSQLQTNLRRDVSQFQLMGTLIFKLKNMGAPWVGTGSISVYPGDTSKSHITNSPGGAHQIRWKVV